MNRWAPFQKPGLGSWLTAWLAIGALAGWMGWRSNDRGKALSALERMVELVSEPFPAAKPDRFQVRWAECLRVVARENHQTPDRLLATLEHFADGLAPGRSPNARDTVLADLAKGLVPPAITATKGLAMEAGNRNAPLRVAEIELLLGELLAADGKLPEAEPHLRLAIKCFRETGRLQRLLGAEARLASLLLGTGRSEEAELLWRRCINRIKARPGEKPPPIAFYLAERGESLLNLGRFADAEALYRESLLLESEQPLDSRASRLYIRHGLGVTLWKLHRLEEAEWWMREALALAGEKWGESRMRTTPSRLVWDLTEVMIAQGKRAESLSLAEWGVRLADRRPATTPEELLRALRLLSEAQFAANRLAAAMATEDRALQAAYYAFGFSRVETGMALGRLAAILRRDGREDEAERVYRLAAGALEKAVGPDDPRVARILTDLGAMLRRQGRLTEAQRYLVRAGTILDERTASGDPRRARTLAVLGSLELELNSVENGETLLRRAVGLVRKAPAEYSTDAAKIYSALGEALAKEERFDAAARFCRIGFTLIAELNRRNGAPLPELGMLRREYQECLEKQGFSAKTIEKKLAEAERPSAAETFLAEQR